VFTHKKEFDMPTKIKSKQTVLFAGDSITDGGRRADSFPLGNGYVRFFRDLMIIREPEKQVTILNKGIGGNTVVDLSRRWTDDVLRMRPDWLSIQIGINDLLNYMRKLEIAVPPELYEQKYREILDRTRKTLPKCQIILIEPFYISSETFPNNFRHDMLQLLPTYLAVVHKLSRQYKTRLVRTHQMFQKIILTQPADMLSSEPVHPNATGSLALAEAVYAGFC
jgi:lysophospholipase L1-like esterase